MECLSLRLGSLGKWHEEEAMGQERVASAAEVAQEIRRHLPGVEDVRLHKLLYYVQGSHLVWQGHPAFSEPIEAGESGPVVAQFRTNEHEGADPPSAAPLAESVKSIVVHAIAQVGDMSNRALIAATRGEDPWSEATDGGANVCGQEISRESLAVFFGRLSPDLSTLKERVDGRRDERPFVPDPPGAIGALRAQYLSA